MSDAIRDRVLDAALPEIASGGFTDAVLTAAGETAGVSKRELLDAYPQGPASLVEAFSHWADARMTERMKSEMPERMRERVRNAVMARIDAMTPHKEAARKAVAYLAPPQNAALATRLSMRSVDLMWRAAGDTASDFSYYTKRAMLAGVYGATLLYWLNDTSEDAKASWEFLEHRIGNVMQIEKFKREASKALSKLPNPLDILSGLRGGRR